MNKQLNALLDRQAQTAQQSASAHQEILANSIDPHRAAFLLNQIRSDAIDWYVLTQAISVEIENSKKSWWARLGL